MPYLFCNSCDLFYEVPSKEINDLNKCECGDELRYYDSLDEYLYEKGKIKKGQDTYLFNKIIRSYESSIAKIILYCVKESKVPLPPERILQVINGINSDFINNNQLNKLHSYSILPTIREKEFEQIIDILVKKSFLIIDEQSIEDNLVLSHAGSNFLWDSNNVIFDFMDELSKKDHENIDSENSDSIDLPYKLLNDPKGVIRAHVAYLLGETREPKYIDVLCKATEDSNANVRRISASALGKIGQHSAEDSLIKLLKDPRPQVRQYTIRALGKINSKKALTIIEKLKTDTSPYVAQEAESFLSTLKNSETSATHKNDKSISLKNSKETTKIDVDKSSKLTSILLYEPNENERAQAAYTLGNTKDPKYLDVLCKATQDKSSNVRRLAVVALGKIGDKRAEDTFIKLLKDPEPYTRQYAIIGLGKIGSKKALSQIRELTNDSVYHVRNTAYKTLKKFDKS